MVSIFEAMFCCFLWFITGGALVLLILAGCAAGFVLNDAECLDCIKDDEETKKVARFLSFCPGYGLGKKLALWVKELEENENNDL